LLSVLGGLLVAAALPPWGLWPLAFLGVAVYETAAQQAAAGRQRLARGWLFGAAWLFPGMAWMWFLTAPGYLVAASMFAGFHAVGIRQRAVCGGDRRPAAHTLAEALRFCVPFGGVPLASVAIGQAAGPFAEIVRVGGVILLTWFVFQVGFALAGPSPVVPALARKRGIPAKREWHGELAFQAAMIVAGVADVRRRHARGQGAVCPSESLSRGPCGHARHRHLGGGRRNATCCHRAIEPGPRSRRGRNVDVVTSKSRVRVVAAQAQRTAHRSRRHHRGHRRRDRRSGRHP
jgi:hypothetical protein